MLVEEEVPSKQVLDDEGKLIGLQLLEDEWEVTGLQVLEHEEGEVTDKQGMDDEGQVTGMQVVEDLLQALSKFWHPEIIVDQCLHNYDLH